MPEQSFKVDGGIEAVGIITGTSFKRVGGSSTEFLMADGSVDNRTYTTTDTTYDIQARDSGVANRKHIRLSTVGGGNTDVTLVGGSNVSINRNNQELEISSSYTDTNTTYGVSAVSDGSNESIILTAGGSGSGISSVSFVPGSNVTLSRSGNNITIGSTYTDSDTTYSVGDGGLTQNNFTDTLKSKLDGISSGAEVNVQSNWNATSGDSQILNKPTNISTWTNDSGYLTALDDTLTSVTNRGNTTTNDVGIGNLTAGIGTFSGELVVTGNTIIGGDLTVNGTQTIINSNTLQVGDSQILLNKDETGAPSQNAGIQVERGTSPNVQIRWDENGNNWDFTNDGTTYYNIPLTNTTYSVSAVDGDPNKKKIRLTSAQDISPTSTTDDVTLAGGTGITLSRSADEITITNSSPHVDTFPSGGIIMWSGAEAAIPSGWVLCNGNNSTPDLRNKFIVGAGSGGSYSVGNTGGADNVTLTTSQIPAHSHDAGTLDADNAGSHSHSYTYPSGTSTFDNDEDYSAYTGTSSGNTGSSGDHGHNISGDTGNRGGGGSHENRPPYYALCYIMKA